MNKNYYLSTGLHEMWQIHAKRDYEKAVHEKTWWKAAVLNLKKIVISPDTHLILHNSEQFQNTKPTHMTVFKI